MQTYVRTRGRLRSLDYQFLGEAPQDSWWRAYRPVTDLERATILVRSDGRSWQAYIAGIRSARLDSVGTPIQFNLVFAGDCAEREDGSLACQAIIRSATGAAEQGGAHIPGEPLDAQLCAEDVERMLTAPGKETAAAAAGAVRAAYGAEPVPPAAELAPPPAGTALPDGDWIGGAADRDALAAFAARIPGLLDGSHPGRALLLNLVDDDADLDALPEWPGDTGVLSAREGWRLGSGVRSLGKAQPPPDAATEPPETGRSLPERRKMLILAGVAGVVALVILIDWLVRIGGQQPRH